MHKLEKFTIKNFKSIREQTLEIGSLNIFIGGNGSGKSNLIEVFRFLREIVNKNLAGYTGLKGGADTLLYFGRKKSPEMEIFLEFGEGDTSNAYKVKIRGSDDDSLMILSETAFYHEKKNINNLTTGLFLRLRRNRNLNRKDHICASSNARSR